MDNTTVRVTIEVLQKVQWQETTLAKAVIEDAGCFSAEELALKVATCAEDAENRVQGQLSNAVKIKTLEEEVKQLRGNKFE